MNYIASLKDFFKSPKWTMNFLLGGLCCLIPIVGPMVYFGHLITGFWCRSDKRFETFPDFDFGKFGKNLERGVWPILVGLAVSIVLVPVMLVFVFMAMFALGGASNRHDGIGAVGMLVMLMIAVFILVLVAAASILMPPIYLRAARLQDFMPAFNFAYIKRFAMMMWKECLLVLLFGGAVGVVSSVVVIIPCLGTLVLYLFMSVLFFMHFHLANQLYELFLSRGGEPIPLSPKLTEEPPAPVTPIPPPAAPLPPV